MGRLKSWSRWTHRRLKQPLCIWEENVDWCFHLLQGPLFFVVSLLCMVATIFLQPILLSHLAEAFQLWVLWTYLVCQVSENVEMTLPLQNSINSFLLYCSFSEMPVVELEMRHKFFAVDDCEKKKKKKFSLPSHPKAISGLVQLLICLAHCTIHSSNFLLWTRHLMRVHMLGK